MSRTNLYLRSFDHNGSVIRNSSGSEMEAKVVCAPINVRSGHQLVPKASSNYLVKWQWLGTK